MHRKRASSSDVPPQVHSSESHTAGSSLTLTVAFVVFVAKHVPKEVLLLKTYVPKEHTVSDGSIDPALQKRPFGHGLHSGLPTSSW